MDFKWSNACFAHAIRLGLARYASKNVIASPPFSLAKYHDCASKLDPL